MKIMSKYQEALDYLSVLAKMNIKKDDNITRLNYDESSETLQELIDKEVTEQVKLSVIIAKFNNPNVFYNKEYDTLYIKNRYSDATFHNYVLAKVIDNRLEPSSFAYEYKWLYQYWIDGTHIEVDV